MATIRKRGNSYQIRVSCGYDVMKNQINRTMTWRPPEGMTVKQAEKEAQKQAILFEEKCSMGQTTTSVKFEEFAEQWFEEYAKLNLRHTTYKRMKQMTYRTYPIIGHLKLDKITIRHVQQFVNELATNGKNMITGEPLSRKSVIHHLSFVSDVLGYAVRMGMLTDNPCRNVFVPKGEKKEKEIYTIEEIQQLFTLLEDAPLKYRMFFTLAIYSGFRLGELLGLEWKDVDWENSIISVKRTSNYSPERGVYTDTTKTKKSQRSLKFPPLVMDLLKTHKTEQDKERINLGSKWVESDRLFIKWNGEPMSQTAPYHWFRKFCTRNDFRFCDIHSLRHFFASALINEGVDAAAVSGALGHSMISTTTSIYCHVFQRAQLKASEAITSVLDFSSKNNRAS